MDLILRKDYIDRINEAFEALPIVVLIGARQVGKTSIMQSLDTSAFQASVMLIGQDTEVAEVFDKQSSLELYLSATLGPSLDGLLMIDEFQFIPHVSTRLKLLVDKYPHLKVLCSGSSSLDIQRNVEESLAGRVRVIEVLSLSFREYLRFCDADQLRFLDLASNADAEPLLRRVQDRYQEYLVFGGLPRVALAVGAEQKISLLNDINKTYLMNDVRRYVANEHVVGFTRLLRLLAADIGNLVNIDELCRHSQLTRNVVENYLTLLQQMYIIKLIEPFFSNKRKTITKMRKVYFCDLGLRNILNNTFNDMVYRTDSGAVFENEVLLELWRTVRPGDEVRYYRTQSGTEVDFVVTGPRHRVAVESKYSHYERPVSMAALSTFGREHNMDALWVANIDLTATHKGVRFIHGFNSSLILSPEPIAAD